MADTMPQAPRQGETNRRAEHVARRAEELARLLPGILRRTRSPSHDDPLSVLLDAMAEMLLDREQVLDDLDAHYDPKRAPLDSLLFLAYWVDLEPLIAPEGPAGLGWTQRDDLRAFVQERFPTGVDRLRALVAEAVPLMRQRSTPRGLERFLETATGQPGFEVIESAERPFHIRVVCPAEARRHQAFVERIIAVQKPAYLTHTTTYRPDENERGQCHE
jgi:hypothetical protein